MKNKFLLIIFVCLFICLFTSACTSENNEMIMNINEYDDQYDYKYKVYKSTIRNDEITISLDDYKHDIYRAYSNGYDKGTSNGYHEGHLEGLEEGFVRVFDGLDSNLQDEIWEQDIDWIMKNDIDY